MRGERGQSLVDRKIFYLLPVIMYTVITYIRVNFVFGSFGRWPRLRGLCIIRGHWTGTMWTKPRSTCVVQLLLGMVGFLYCSQDTAVTMSVWVRGPPLDI